MDLGEIKPRHTLDETVEQLISLHDMGIKATCNFNGHIFDSETVTMDSAYQTVMGCTKAEFDKQTEEMKKRREYSKPGIVRREAKKEAIRNAKKHNKQRY